MIDDRIRHDAHRPAAINEALPFRPSLRREMLRVFRDEQTFRLSVADLLFEKPADRRTPPMPDEGPRRKAKVETRRAQTPAKIHIVARRAENRVEAADGIEGGLGDGEIATRQVLDVFSPANFLATNPDVLKRTRAEGGQNLVRGALNAVEDWERWLNHKPPVGVDAFQAGRDVAITPGKDFGFAAPERHVRIAYTQPVARLEEAMGRLRVFLAGR